jgi:hypothetical protein
MKRIIGFVFIVFIIVGCDPAIGYEYYLNNQSDSILLVHFRINGYNQSKDSIVKALPNTEILFYDAEMWGKNPHDEKNEFLNLFDSIAITKENGTLIKKDIYQRENWTYEKDISHNVFIKTGTNIYRLKLSNEDL